MSGNIKFRWFLLASIVVALLVVVSSPVMSLAGELEDAQEAVRQNPNDAKAHFNLGLAYNELGQYQDAIPHYEETIRISPTHPKIYDAHWGLGSTYSKLGQHQEAIASYKEALRIKPGHAVALLNLESAYDELGQYKEAITSYKEALRTEPDFAKTHYGLGRVYIKSGRYQEAIAPNKEAIRIKPDQAGLYRCTPQPWGCLRTTEPA